jgi:P pilus assembly chaperone PapD
MRAQLDTSNGALVFWREVPAGLRGHRLKATRPALRWARSPHWVKVKNPKASAAKAEEDWDR